MSKVWVTKGFAKTMYHVWREKPIDVAWDKKASIYRELDDSLINVFDEKRIRETYPGIYLPKGNKIVEVEISGKVVEG